MYDDMTEEEMVDWHRSSWDCQQDLRQWLELRIPNKSERMYLLIRTALSMLLEDLNRDDIFQVALAAAAFGKTVEDLMPNMVSEILKTTAHRGTSHAAH